MSESEILKVNLVCLEIMLVALEKVADINNVNLPSLASR
jgi:hypothetical protein